MKCCSRDLRGCQLWVSGICGLKELANHLNLRGSSERLSPFAGLDLTPAVFLPQPGLFARNRQSAADSSDCLRSGERDLSRLVQGDGPQPPPPEKTLNLPFGFRPIPHRPRNNVNYSS